ncbi:MAG: TubC N-terminal docking domain-related protein [Ruminiclostridium sp.]
MEHNCFQTKYSQLTKQFVTDLMEKNIKFWVKDGELCYKAPKEIVTADILKYMSEKKEEIIGYISASASQQNNPIECPNNADKLSSIGMEEYPQSMELIVVMQKEITTWLHRSLPLCVVLAFKKYLPWYYSNFIQIFSFTNENGYIELNYLEPRDCCSEIVDMICLGYPLLKKVENIIDYIIENINMGYYLIINVDEYYLPNKWAYEKLHFIHSSLIYGYDNKEKQLKAIGFKQNIFTEITFDYTQFIQAYENGRIHYKDSAPWCEWSAIQLMRPKKFELEYPFSNESFLKELKSYLFSIGDSIKLYSFEYYENRVEFGFQVYDVIIKNLENLIQGNITMDYRPIHLIGEHKKCIYDRIGYVISRNNLTGEIVKLHEEYMEVVKRFNIIRIKFLKYLKSFGNTNIYNPNISNLTLEQKSKIKDIINKIKELKTTEYDILIKIYYQLELSLNTK